jgi:hypothetical protein
LILRVSGVDMKTILHTGAGNAGKARNTGKFKTT